MKNIYKKSLITIIILIILLFIIFGKTFATLSFSIFAILSISIFKIFITLKNSKSKHLKIFNRSVMVVFILLISSFTAIQALIYSSSDARLTNKKYDYIIILGAGLKNNRIPIILKNRLDKAIEVNKVLKCKIIVSGGKGDDEYISEAKAMREYLILKGVDNSRITLEDKSTSTAENLKYSRKIIGESFNGEVLVISNDFHIFRIKLLAQKMDFNITTVAAPTPLFIKINALTREYFAVPKSYLFD